jgi:phenylacetaldehyde dehydrogenase
LSDTTSNVSQITGYAEAMEWLKGGPKQLLIDGKHVSAKSGKTFQAINPATEEVLAEVAEGDSADVDAAVASARKAFESAAWTNMSPHARGKLLSDVADLVDKHADQLAVLETLDLGAPIVVARNFVKYCAQTFRYYAGWPTKIMGTTSPSDPGRLIYGLREPLGVCGLINPWNAPLNQAATKIAPALACGNTAVIKPAELTNFTTLRLAELMLEAGVPAGVLNVVTGYGNTVGTAITNHPDVNKVSFTGSTAVGKQILAASAGNFKKVTLELGGKSPNIIFPDADIDKAITAAASTFTRNSGQICSAGTRLFVHEAAHDEVAEKVTKLASGYKVGSPFEPGVELGPLISSKQMERVLSYMEAGKSQGATASLDGSRMGDVGFFVQPTIFSRVDNSMKIAREEIFGPVLSIIPFKDEDDAVFQGNNTEYGLAAAVWTRDISRAHKVARRLQSGRVWINTYGEIDQVMSVGGYKQSGVGREMGPESIDAYTQTKSVIVRL